MTSHLKVSVGQYSDKGRKALNQDFYGVSVPKSSQLDLKGVAVAMADGISSSDVSHIASETAVKNFLQDYYCTSDAWSVKNSAQKVLGAANSWLYSQSQQSQYRDDKNRGYVCTFSAVIFKSTVAHIFHLGDTRVYRINSSGVEQLTKDHRIWLSQDKSYLSRALGIDPQCEFDYQTLRLNTYDIFILATDGVYEFIEPLFFSRTIEQQKHDLDLAAKTIVEQAIKQGSDDNLSIQIVRVDTLPIQISSEVQQQIDELPFPPILEARAEFDGYSIIRELHASSRSHVYLAKDIDSGSQVILKTPSMDQRGDPIYLERFLTEEWIARRINSAYILKASLQQRKRNFIYTVFEFIDGQTLTQWIIDNPQPDIESVRCIIEQIAKGLHALHRMEMLHQDIKPDNIIIDHSGTVKIIDFGSVSVAGLLEKNPGSEQNHLLGTIMYSAPELFLGECATTRSELFSLGVMTYFMLSGRFPYGTEVSKSRTLSAQNRLEYHSVLDKDQEIPAWVDHAIRRAVNPNPHKRYQQVSEFIHDLRHPNKAFLNKTRQPLLERNPVAFWQGISLGLAMIIMYLLSS